ncbi:adenylosuccinate lyase [Methanocella paludicola SANAE]|uniref:Adenylosuccinate lyase n=1 Tax=Methanocella paludicola (strain DSM 17711 / JCM 13418 / NBRC 101707 / SANAE) TaxID=304371 RepID=D1Z1C8_METPS|nr:adenylosuccinate lyase [Methanocella paludicola]BAI62500.1 adenylosuccinate lyase [Methanocella paludicola SANAE]
MAIHPIEFRYGTPEMKAVWTEESKLLKLLMVEAALAKAEAEVGLVSRSDAETIASCMNKVNVERVRQIEDEISHDMMAVVLAYAEQCGEAGKWIHYGATSNDILDTGLALQLKDAMEIIDDKLEKLKQALLKKADETKTLVTAGRTHGQLAVPTTYGLRFAIWAMEVARHQERLRQMKPRVAVGQMSGAVGTQAAFGKDGIRIKELTMRELGIPAVTVSSQIIQRDRHAEYMEFLALVASTLDKICLEIRLMQRSEIGELAEGFGKKQVGSSTMPHKRNPINSEQVCGLARVVRAYVEPALENNALWDERDLTNSSCERVIIPEASILLDHILRKTINVISGLTFYPENIKRNLNVLKGVQMSEAVMIALANRGFGRQKAHEIVRSASMKAFEHNMPFRQALMEDTEISGKLTPAEIDEITDPAKYIGTAMEQVEEVLRKEGYVH